MAIYRGEGGSGDATADATNQALIAINAANAASTSASNAANSASNAASSATSASASATSAANSASSASSVLSNALDKTNNLSDLVDVSVARTNLGLGTAATTNASAYATAAQGVKADTALQSIADGSITTAKIADVNVTSAKLANNAVTPAKMANGGAEFGMRNRLINGQGLINQRAYVSGTATSGSNQYTLDRWRVVTSGQNLTFSTTANVTTFTAPAGGVEQVIEGLNLESGTYVLSWTGTATATVGGTAVTNGGTISVTGGTNTTVKFIGGTFSLPQFEKGSTASPFDWRSHGAELALCQRYYYKNLMTEVGGVGFCRTTTQVGTLHPFPVEMRTVPTSLEVTPTATDYRIGTGAIATVCNAVPTFNTATRNAAFVFSTVASGLTVGQGCFLGGNSANAFLGWSAEL